MAATEFQIPESWFRGRESVRSSDIVAVVPNGRECDFDTLLTVLSESSTQLQHQGPLDLKTLDVRFEDLTTRGIEAIASMVNAGLLQNLERLSVERGNEARSPAIYLGPAVAVIAEMLQLRKMPNLKSFSLSGFDFEDEISLKSFESALQCDQLHILGELHLVSNRLSGNVIMEIIKAVESRQPIMSNLFVLDLKGNNLGVEGAIAVAEAQRLQRHAQDLDLSGNGFGDQGVMAIAGALKSGLMSRLRVLRLSKNGIGDDGIIALVEALKFGKARSLQSLYLDLNAIGDRGGLYVADALEKGATHGI